MPEVETPERKRRIHSIYGERMTRLEIYVPQYMIDWLDGHRESMAATIRNLIDQAIEAEKAE